MTSLVENALLDTSAGPLPRLTPQVVRQRRHSYTSLAGLRRLVEGLDAPVPVTAVLVLDDSFCGHLSSLIRRRPPCRGSRLILVAAGGRLPGLETLGDLAMAGGALGWQEIVLERDPVAALTDARATLHHDEELVVFTPAWHAA